MAFTKLTKDMGIIAKLEDEPNDVGGLTAAQLKAKFDEAGEAVKAYLNDTLLAELAAPTAADALGAALNGENVTVQHALDMLALAGVKSGNVPLGGYEGDLLRKRSDALYDLEWVQPTMFTTFTFAASDWIAGEEGVYLLTIPQNYHQRAGANFGCVLRHQVDGVLKSNTWAALGTQSAWDPDTADIVLTSPDPYDGVALFFGEGIHIQRGGNENAVVLLTGEHDADTEIAADIEGESYSLENVSDEAETAADGTIIIKKVEE